MTYKEKLDKFTFLVPIFNLEGDRLENFKFTLAKIREVTNNLVVVEQVSNMGKVSEAKQYTKKMGIDYLPILMRSKSMNKSVLINNATDYISTEFVWVNDADCYLKFSKVIEKLKFDNDFIQPYEFVKFIDKKSSSIIKGGNKCNIDFKNVNTACSGCMYGALSFLYRRSSFKNIGGMNSLLGLYHEDTEFCYRIIKNKKYNIQIIFGIYGIHLHHEYNNRDRHVKTNGKRVSNLHNVSLNVIINEIEDYYRQLFLKTKKIEILTMFRGDLNLLENITKFINSSSKEIEDLDIVITWVCNSECLQFKKAIHKNSQINKRINIHQGSDLGGHNKDDYLAGDIHYNIGSAYDDYFRKSNADIIITLEDDVLPLEKNAISKLLLSLIKHPSAAIVCATYESRHISQYHNKKGVSIGFLIGEKYGPLMNTIKNTGLREMSWVGGGFTAYDLSTFMNINHFTSEFSNTSPIGWDIFLSNYARKSGKSVLLDTNIFCDHVYT